MDADRLNWLAEVVLDYAFRMHTDLGPGMLESVYCDILADCLRSRGLEVQQQVLVPIVYRGKTYSRALRADMIVEGALIVEVKSIERLSAAQYKQALTYLTLTGLRLGLLINFGAYSLKHGIKRFANGL